MNLEMTQRLEHIEKKSHCYQIHECQSAVFNRIRTLARLILTNLFIEDGDREQNRNFILLRNELIQWITLPTQPSITIFSEGYFPNEERVRQNYGSEMVNNIGRLKKLIVQYNEQPSVLIENFVKAYQEAIEEHGQEQVKIWCERREIERFQQLLPENQLDKEDFICSVAEYRSSPFFHAFFKVGPFRNAWSSPAPSVIVTSPVYEQLVQFRWKGQSNEDGWGTDPVFPQHNFCALFEKNETILHEDPRLLLPEEEPPQEHQEVDDDFTFLKDYRVTRKKEDTNCFLAELTGNRGVLLRPNEKQLILHDENSGDFMVSTLMAKNLKPGHWLLAHDVSIDSATMVGKAPCAEIWKSVLRKKYESQGTALLRKISNYGISRHPESAVPRWMRPPDSVIHAPRQQRHFMILMTSILKDQLEQHQEWQSNEYDWKQAWNEISLARGKAIQDGRIGSQLVKEEIIENLNIHIEEIAQFTHDHEYFKYPVPPEIGLTGTIQFLKVLSILSGTVSDNNQFGTIQYQYQLQKQFLTEIFYENDSQHD